MSLSYDQQSSVIGKAPGKLLKGGLGALGVGQMWFDGDDTDPAYADVPVVPFRPGAMYVGKPPRADSPERDRSEAIPLACRDCGLLFTGDPKHDDACPVCGSEEIERR